MKEKGKWTIYVTYDRGIHGTMNAALLACKKLAKVHKSCEVMVNPHDFCVWNNMVNQKKLTIIFTQMI